MSKTLYVSGPMTGLPNHNIPAFEYATARLRAAGYRVLSPHEGAGTRLVLFMESQGVKLTKERIYRICLPGDAAMVAESDFIVCLPGFEASRGGAWELQGGDLMKVTRIQPPFESGMIGLEQWIDEVLDILEQEIDHESARSS